MTHDDVLLNSSLVAPLCGEGEPALYAPGEGLWSISMERQQGWPTGWMHAQPTAARTAGDWLILTGKLTTEHGDWHLRDARRKQGDRVQVIRRWEWHGHHAAENVTLSVRAAAHQPGAALFMPGFCCYGNPSGRCDLVAKFEGNQGDELLCEEHRLPMPFASLEWCTEDADEGWGAALHTLPGPVTGSDSPDLWWSIGARGVEQSMELCLLSGPCVINGQRGYVKANQGKWYVQSRSALTILPGTVIEKSFWLQAYPAKKGAGFRVPVKESLRIFQPFCSEGLPAMREIVEAKLRCTLSRWLETDGIAGFRMHADRNLLVMGWCGQADAPGYYLPVLAQAFPGVITPDEAERMSLLSLQHLAKAPFTEAGFLVEYSPEERLWKHQDPVSQGQAMENIARAVQHRTQQMLPEPEEVASFLHRACDLHASRILSDTWRPVSTNEAFLISPLCRGFALFGSQQFRAAALRAGEQYAERHLQMQEPYWGGTLDASCEDKEGAWAAFQGFLAIYELTDNPLWLERAEHAMDLVLSYTVVWDIDLPPGRLRDHNLKTRGWTVVSAQNQHLDVYGVLYTPEIYRMGIYLDREDLRRLAAVMYRTCGQLIDPDGSQGEQLNHTCFSQMRAHFESAAQMRGTYSEGWTVFWITAHFLSAAAEFVRMGVHLDGDH